MMARRNCISPRCAKRNWVSSAVSMIRIGVFGGKSVVENVFVYACSIVLTAATL
jgi:hypothetical protein